jgi:ABC-type polysaccharide/polyol phosphate transport system ATPase subunit/SAM-dependent methyltransferase
MPSVIEAHQVSKQFFLRRNRVGSLKEQVLAVFDARRREVFEPFWALRDITMTVRRGESLGLIGRNGSGKSTLLKLIAGIHRPTGGRLLVRRGARIGSMIELGVGFHGELSGTENVYLNASVHGLTRPEIDALYPRIVEYSGLGGFMDLPLKNFSSGMHMRLGFAISAHLDPDILLVDEVFAVGDADFQQRCMQTMRAFAEEGRTIVFVSHAAPAVKAICHRVCLLHDGRLLFDGDVDRGLREYQRVLADPEVHGRPLPGPSASERPSRLTEGEAAEPWHRAVHGGRWAEAGRWQYEFLRSQGLRPDHFVLDVGCGSLAGALHLLPFMEQSHYWGIERERALFEAGVQVELARANVRPERGHFVINERFDLSEVPYRFDFAIANSLFARLSLNEIARVVVNVTRHLKPDGRFYATWFDNPDPLCLEAIARPGGLVTYPDAEPYHYAFAQLAAICQAAGVAAERLDDRSHPRGEAVMVMRRTP